MTFFIFSIALIPRCGLEPWADFPVVEILSQRAPFSATKGVRSVGSPTITASPGRPCYGLRNPCLMAVRFLIWNQMEHYSASIEKNIWTGQWQRWHEEKRQYRPSYPRPLDRKSSIFQLSLIGRKIPLTRISGRNDIEMAIEISLRPPLPHLFSATIFHLPFGERRILTLKPILRESVLKEACLFFIPRRIFGRNLNQSGGQIK